MSTRGAIACPTPGGGWIGRYHHFDAYPTGLGHELFRLYHDTFNGDHELMAQTLIDEHPAGWSTLIAPTTVDGDRPFTTEHFAYAGFQSHQDPLHGQFPQCYCHGQRCETADALICRCHLGETSGCAPLFIEWAYVITSSGLGVLTSHHPHAGSDADDRHRPVAFVGWSDNPNWQVLEHRPFDPHLSDLTA
ncbi:hypothetical protein [Nocardiopsis nanhaiensis]